MLDGLFSNLVHTISDSTITWCTLQGRRPKVKVTKNICPAWRWGRHRNTLQPLVCPSVYRSVRPYVRWMNTFSGFGTTPDKSLGGNGIPFGMVMYSDDLPSADIDADGYCFHFMRSSVQLSVGFNFSIAEKSLIKSTFWHAGTARWLTISLFLLAGIIVRLSIRLLTKSPGFVAFADKLLRGNDNYDNYRGIALSSALGKVLDLFILSRYTSNLSSNDLQFAFKAKHSTVMCTSALKEIISHYTKRASNVYMCSLDATKAFDKVNFVKLFKLLLQRNIPSIVLRLIRKSKDILDLYIRQSVKAAWNCEKSFSFDVMNGVRQGGVLTPILFNVYFDELLHRLQQKDIGCHIWTIFTGALCYADDLLLLCPTIRALQKMITICSEFATEYDVTFNPSKTACMAFGNRYVCPHLHLYLDGKMLEWTDTFKHLGNFITADQKDDSDIQLKRGNFYRSVNGLCYKFKGTLLKSDVASRLFQTYCCSFYGSQAWNLSSFSFEFIWTAWNKVVRKNFHLPYNTHRYILSFIVQTSHIRYQLVERFRTFFATCMSSENILINLLALNAHFCNSPMSMNWRYADKLLVEKMIWLRRKAVMQLYCHHCSK